MTPRKRKVLLFTLGCKINQYDTDLMASLLREEGHELVTEPSDAEVILVNTCTVTGRTDYKGRQQVRKLGRENPLAVLMVTGCYAEVQPDRIAGVPGVDYVLGNLEKRSIAGWVSSCAKQPVPVVRAGNIGRDASPLEAVPLEVHSGHTRAFLKIQDGCNYSCSYCIIPKARGRSRSLPPLRVMEKVRYLAGKGFQEVVLCGIHLGAYGQDLSPAASLPALLEELAKDGTMERVRISSIEPNEVTAEMISLFAGSSTLCPHFHLPLQSGDAGILRAMRRPYGPGDFLDLVSMIKERIPEAAIGVDVIAGFPGEDEGAFRNTSRLLESLPVSYLHVFPFSPRPGTEAARFENQVPAEVVHERARLLRRLGEAKRRAFYRGFVDKRLDILVEARRDAATGMLKGFTKNYVPVLFDGPDRLKGRVVEVRIRSVEGRRVLGTCTVSPWPAAPGARAP